MTINRKKLVESVAEACGITRVQSAEVIEAALVHIADALVQGHSVELRGFGCLRPRVDAGRIVRDPQKPDKGSYRMPARTTVKFIPGRSLMAELNRED